MKKCTKNVIGIVAIAGFAVVIGILITIHSELGTKTYIFPENLIDYMGFDIEEQIADINQTNSTQDICTEVYAMEDGSLAVKLNKKQWGWWIENVNGKIEKFEKDVAEKGGKLKVSDDRTSIIFEASPKLYMEYISAQSYLTSICAGEYQILTGTNPEEWHVYLCFKNMETGEIIAEGTLPYDTIEFTDEDLK